MLFGEWTRVALLLTAYANAKYRLPGDDLLPAGLLGPVELVRMK